MAQVNADRVREQATFAGGTGAVTLTGTPVSGFQSFLSGWGASGSGWVGLVMGAQWEVCEASINAGGTTLTRGTVISSSTGSQINFSAGTIDCFSVIPGSKLGLVGDGTVGAPALSFYNDRDCGFYRIGANNVGLALNGAKVADYSTAGESITGTLTVSGLITATAGQIAFPASQNASANVNTLDDYEEGTFTPGVSFGGGTTGITYTTQVGFYTKVGNRVFANFREVLSSKGSSTGSAKITGLPFAVTSTASAFSVAPLYVENMATQTGWTAFTVINTTTLQVNYISSGTNVDADNTVFNNTSAFIGTLHYLV